MDVSAPTLFAMLWVIDTQEHKASLSKKCTVCEVFKDLDGTRSQQYTRSVRLPPPFKERIVSVWRTWEEVTKDDGRRKLIVVSAPIETYK
ncbi:hypothetical protein TrVE_jg9069, partial [Triparma verrucosa]